MLLKRRTPFFAPLLEILSIMIPSLRKQELCRALEETRARTLRLLDAVPDDFLKVRVHDFYSPVGWHFGHIGMTEEFWACGEALGLPPRDPHLTFLFANLPENPKDNRVHLPSRAEILSYLAATRCTVLDALDTADLSNPNPLLEDGYAWEFALEHECQHQETICELLQLVAQRLGNITLSGYTMLTNSNTDLTPLRDIPGGTFVMGLKEGHGYDNEQKAHEVTVEPFQIEGFPVTSARWLAFMEDGGYQRREMWSEAGWAWREAENVEMPEYWFPVEEGGYGYFGAFGARQISPREPVSSISWYEADAYARWAGRRLPTEAEWEYVARFDPQSGASRHFPWEDAENENAPADCNINRFAPLPVEQASRLNSFGLLGLSGGIWEWTASPFLPYPGFEAFPYDGYSKDHMDGHHFVCRGGSWATNERLLRCSFRNWYVPTYRQGFLGVRCAK